MKWTPEKRLAWIAATVLILDQLTKWLVLQSLPQGREIPVIAGFFRLVHWGNTGAAWSLFHGNNRALAAISLVALVVLYLARRYFDGHTPQGQVAVGLILGGIAGNLIDRLIHHHVIDFLYFHLIRRDGVELGFHAFNIADTAICTGVGIVLLRSFLPTPSGQTPNAPEPATEDSAPEPKGP